MEQRNVNPWTWQDRYAFSQAVEVTRANRVVCCAGQISADADGNTVHPGDMAAQTARALDNLEVVLGEAGMSMANVVRLNYYVTDIDRFFEGGAQVISERMAAAGIQPAGTLLGITRLAFPDLLIEI